MENDETNIIISYYLTNNKLLCTTNTGFILYQTNPFKCLFNRYIDGGIRLGYFNENNKNIFYLSGTGLSDKWCVNRVTIWNDHLQKKVTEISISNRIEVFFVTNNNQLIIASKRHVYIYNIDNYELIKSFNICSYSLKYGYIDNSLILSHALLVNDSVGQIMIRVGNTTKLIPAHNNNIQLIAICNNTNIIATCTDKGDIIKLFNITTGNLINEYRRGSFSATITYLGFSDNDNWLLCGTYNGSVHFFNTSDINTSFLNLWGIFRKRAAYIIQLHEPIKTAILIENTNTFYIVGTTKFYSGVLLNNSVSLNKSVLLIYKQDPFNPSPKLKKQLVKLS